MEFSETQLLEEHKKVNELLTQKLTEKTPEDGHNYEQLLRKKEKHQTSEYARLMRLLSWFLDNYYADEGKSHRFELREICFAIQRTSLLLRNLFYKSTHLFIYKTICSQLPLSKILCSHYTKNNLRRRRCRPRITQAKEG